MKRLVHGTPIPPRRLLPQLRGGSFCVSYMNPEQLNDCIDLVGDDQILILDNGAFTAWRQGLTLDAAHWNGFYAWANEAMARCPQAVAVIPDVIEGSEQDNLQMIAQALRDDRLEFPERSMAIWHMNESIDQLERLFRIFNFVGFGSCRQYDIARHSSNSPYSERVQEIWAFMQYWQANHCMLETPWIHMMRGLGVLHKIGFDSADSCNIAINHHRTKSQFNHVRAMADRIAAKVANSDLPPLPLFQQA